MEPIYQIPMVSLNDNQVGKGYRRVNIGEPLKTSYEVYLITDRSGWVLTSFYTKDKQVNNGVSNYREAVSLGARLKGLPALLGKVWKGWRS